MVITKQDQLQSTLDRETASQVMLPVFTTPPLTSPTVPFPLCMTPKLPDSFLEAASALDSCDLESIMSNLSWSPPEISWKPQIYASGPTFKQPAPAKPYRSSTAAEPSEPDSVSSTAGTSWPGPGGLSSSDMLQPGTCGLGTFQQGAGAFSITTGSWWFRNIATGSWCLFRSRSIAPRNLWFNNITKGSQCLFRL